MNFSCYKEDLADALKAVMPSVAVKPQTPILSGVYLKADNSALEIRGSNLKTGVVAKIPANVEEPGEGVVGGKKFQEFVAKMPDNTLTCETANNSLLIRSGGADVSLLTMNVADFPKVQTAREDQSSFNIKQGALYNLIRKTILAVSDDKIGRPLFTGVNFEYKDDCLTAVSTNTHRLALAKTPLELGDDHFSFTVPAAVLNALLARLNPKDLALTVNISFTEHSVAFTVENVYITARLLDGQFPPYERIIPTDSTTRVQVNPAEFKQAIEIVALMAKETEYNTVKLNLHSNLIEISANSIEVGTAEKSVEADIDGEDLSIAFNFSYLTDVLRVVNAPKINIAFNDKFSPALVTVPGDDDFLYVVTPVRA